MAGDFWKQEDEYEYIKRNVKDLFVEHMKALCIKIKLL